MDLVERQAAGLCIELHTYIPSVPEEVITYANEKDFPIIVFEHQVRFIDLTREVYEFLHFPNAEAHTELFIEKIWNEEVSPNEVVEDVNSWCEAKSLQGYCSVILHNETSFSLAKLKAYAESEHFVLIHAYVDSIPGDVIVWLDQLQDINTSKQRVEHVLFRYIEVIICFGKPFLDAYSLIHSIPSVKTVVSIAEKRKQVGLIWYSDLHIEKLVNTLAGHPLLFQWMDEYIHPIQQYDDQHDSSLVDTLRTYLNCQGNKKETANRLYVVRQTLYHRLERLEDILGGDFMEPSKRLMLEILLKMVEEKERV